MNIPKDDGNSILSHEAPSTFLRSCLKLSFSTTQVTDQGSSDLTGPITAGPGSSGSSVTRKKVTFKLDPEEDDPEKAQKAEAARESLDTEKDDKEKAAWKSLDAVLPKITTLIEALEARNRGFQDSSQYIFLEYLAFDLTWATKTFRASPKTRNFEHNILRAKSNWEALDAVWGTAGARRNDIVRDSWPSIQKDLRQVNELIKDATPPGKADDCDSEDSLFD